MYNQPAKYTSYTNDLNKPKTTTTGLFLPPKETNKLNQNSQDEDNKSSSSSNAKSRRKSFKKKLNLFFNKQQFHFAIIILVVIVCLLIAGEIVIENVKLSIKISNNSNTISSNRNRNGNSLNNNDHHHVVNDYPFHFALESKMEEDNNNDFEFDKSVYSVLEGIEKMCKYGSLVILTIFVIEIIIKIFYVSNIYRNNFLEILDIFIVNISCGLNMLLLYKKSDIHSITGLIIILRLWRIINIIESN